METLKPESVENLGWPTDPTQVRHVLSLSGGKDSAALAVHLRDRVSNMEYIFHDTDKELPDTYDYLERLEGYLGSRIVKTTFGKTFDDLLRGYGGMLPSNHRRWCTKMMKLKPFENYIRDDFCINYVGIRADEDRVGYISHKPNIRAVFPFCEDGISYEGVLRILEDSGLGMPPYTEWGRTRAVAFSVSTSRKSNGFGLNSATLSCLKKPKPMRSLILLTAIFFTGVILNR